MTAISMRKVSHTYRLSFAACVLGVTMFAAGMLSRSGVVTLPPASEPSGPVFVRVASALPVEYYVTDDETHAGKVRTMFEAVNGTRRANGEPVLKVAVIDSDMDTSAFLKSVASEDRGAGVVIHDLRNRCGVCPTDEPEW